MNLLVLIIKNIKAFFRMKSTLVVLVVLNYLQLIILWNTYENYMGTYKGTAGFAKIVYVDFDRGFDPLKFYCASVLVQMIYFLSILAASLAVSEKENRILLRILASPTKKIQILLGNLLGAHDFNVCHVNYFYGCNQHFIKG